MTLLPPPPPDPWVFAVEPDAVQITWRGDGAGRPPGATTIGGLSPGARHQVEVGGLGRAMEVTTAVGPRGPELCRIATVNDLHIGCRKFGWTGRMHEPPAAVPHAVRCTRNALADALEWGAQLVVVKGDLTHYGREEEWEQIGELLNRVPVPVVVVPGNHDVKAERRVEPQPALARQGLHLVHGVEVVELPGIRLVLADTTLPGEDRGHIGHLGKEIARIARRAPGGVLLGVHHHLEAHRVPTFLPTGVPGPESNAFLAELAAANPNTFVTTGHTHRHRRHRRAGLTVTEVGSTKDFPGTWTGYAVHEGGIRQVVRRVSDPSCLPWLDDTARAVLGVWGRWSPGTLADRCFSVSWR